MFENFCYRIQQYVYTMGSANVIFMVHFGGRFDRPYKCTYVGGKIGLFDEPFDLDCLLFIEIETIVKKFRYQPGDLIYYCQPDKYLGDGLVLITSNDDVIRMTECFLGHKVVVLYTMSFAHADAQVCANVGEVDEDEHSDDEERMMNVINDPFWKSLMSNDDDDWDDGCEPRLNTSTRGDDTSTHGDREGVDERVMMGMVMRRMEDVGDDGMVMRRLVMSIMN
jgi:hypothetical protein